ncbi:MAG: SRPBCC domain-containing protein [Acidimicrobiia bacterium]|nr:SRPBCC domain-containing protein [Acidimicrobiia bacterium]
MNTGAPVEAEVRIAARPETVFPYLVEPDQLMRWMGEEAKIDPRPGGQFWLRIGGDDIAVGTYLTVDPPRQVVFTWGWVGNEEVPPGCSTVTFDLRADGDDTVVSLTHRDLPESWCDRHLDGWNHFLPALPEAISADR